MTIEILVIRHAEAVRSGLMEDFERPLTERGKAQTATHRTYLQNHLLKPHAIYASSARRVRETMAGLGLKESDCRFIGRELYEATLQHFSKVLADYPPPADCKQVIHVGHNPFVSQLCSHLSGQELIMDTCEMYRLRVDEDSFQEALQMPGCWSIAGID